MKAQIRAARLRMQNYFEEKSLHPTDIPKAILVHELLGMFILCSTWSMAHRFPPTKIPFLAGPIKQMERMIPASIKSAATSNKIINRITNSKYGASYIEASCFRKIVRPITIPLKLATTFMILKSEILWKLHPRVHISSSECGGGNMCSLKPMGYVDSSCEMSRMVF